jgi:hypothetical protein
VHPINRIDGVIIEPQQILDQIEAEFIRQG